MVSKTPPPSSGSEDPTLRLYAIVRADLEMPAGKLAAQAGHAYLEAYLTALREIPDLALAYAADPPGTKVVLAANSLAHLERLASKAEASRVPYTLITDSGHILPPHFDGRPIVTALGFGPARRSEIRHITGGLALIR